MSTIDPRLNSALPGGFDALDRQARLDAGLDSVLAELAGGEDLRPADAVPADIAVLVASAEGPDMFDIAGQQATLAQFERGEAVEQGVDDILSSLAA